MAMNLANADGDEDEMNATINTTPLVDVMLVLLIIFLITIPVVNASVPLELPKERNLPTQTKPENIVIAVNRDGELFWGIELLADADTLLATAEDRVGAGAAARGAHPRRRRGALRKRRPRGVGGAACRHRQGGLHHRAAGRAGGALMAMNLNAGGDDDEPLVEMNMTPLIDVMLVLLIMFIITIPIQTHAVKMNMPVGESTVPPKPPEIVRIDVDFDGTIGWNGEIVPDREQLEARLAQIAALPDQPELHLRPNKLVTYKVVAMILASAQRLGVTKIGIVGNEQFL